jgi:hypothetical protein
MRQPAARAGASTSGRVCGTVLDRLVAHGLVLGEDAGRALRAQVEQLVGNVLAWTGNNAVVIEQNVSGLPQSRPPVVEELRRDGIDLSGISVRSLFGGGW